jgi:hypothetical protein
MKLKTPYKTVMFYGYVLRINAAAAYIAADSDGRLFSFAREPVRHTSDRAWVGAFPSFTGLTVEFESGVSWQDTLTYCKGDGQEWMLAFKTKIAVEHALWKADAITQEEALCNATEAAPFGTLLDDDQWAGFRKHSGVEDVASKDFLDALKAKMKPAATRYIEAEKGASHEDDSRLIRDYYGGELVIPEWVRFIAMDSDGAVWGYELLPESTRGKACKVGWRSEKTANKEWRDSLREVQP